MAFGDFAGGVLRERDRAARRDIASRGATVAEGQLELGRERLGQAQNQFQAAQQSAATQQLIKSSQELASNIEKIIAEGGEIPPSTVKAAEQFVEALKDQPNAQQQVISLFAAARSAATPTQAAVREGQATVAGAEAITQQPLDTAQRQTLAGVAGTKDDLLIRLQDASSNEQNPVRKAQIEALILKMTTQAKGISIFTGDRKGGTVLSKVRTDFLTDVATKGIASQEILNNADLLDSSLDAVQGTALDTGALVGLRDSMASLAILGGFGDNFAESIANLNTIESISEKMRIMETTLLKGAINQREFEAAGKINTNLGNTNLGNRFAVKRMRATANMNAWMLERAEQIETGNPDATDNDIAKQLRKEFSNIPYFSKTLKDQSGLPLFFTEFRENVLSQVPDATMQEILNGWKKANAASR